MHHILLAVLALKAAHLLDPQKGIVDAAVVLVDGDRIAGVNVPIPQGAEVIDLGDATLLPGLIDAHTHVMARVPDGDHGYAEMLATKSLQFRALEGAANARAMLHAGFTSIRDVESEGSGYGDVALRDAVREGLVEGPRMMVATRGIAAVGSYHPFDVAPELRDRFPTGAQLVSGVEEVRRAAREQLGNGADQLKLYADWGTPTLSVDEMAAAVEIAHARKRKVAAHATSAQGIRNALDAGVDSIEHGWDATPELLRRMKEKGVFLVPTSGLLREMAAREKDAAPMLLEKVKQIHATIARAKKAGVPIALGWDASSAADQGHAARELVSLRDAGLTPLEAIRAATVNAAELMGIQAGALEKGKVADVIAVRGDPLQDLTLLQHVVFVMKGGSVVTH